MPRRPGRRRLVTVVGLAAAGLVFAGCTTPGGASAPAAESTTPGPDSTTATAQFPVTVEHAYGSTEIAAEPQRVLTLGLSDQDPVLALGVRPIAVSEWYGKYPGATWPWGAELLGETPPHVLNGGQRDEANPPYEEIAEQAPDLILSLYNGTTKEQYERLSQIAPTVVPDAEQTGFEITWPEATRAAGEALGRSAEAERLISDLQGRFAELADAHPEFVGTEVIIGERFDAGQTVVRSGNDTRALFFSQLGFTVPADLEGVGRNQYDEIVVSDELMGALSRDLLVWNIGFSPEVRAGIEDDPIYQQLPVVRAGKVLWIEDEVVSGAFGWGTVLSLDYALDQLIPELERLTR